jgi:UPF0271 protein
MLTRTADVVDRAVRLATAGEIVAVDGTVLRVEARSLCPVAHARAVHDRLVADGIKLAPFSAG